MNSIQILEIGCRPEITIGLLPVPVPVPVSGLEPTRKSAWSSSSVDRRSDVLPQVSLVETFETFSMSFASVAETELNLYIPQTRPQFEIWNTPKMV
jgi:hypothetical protein